MQHVHLFVVPNWVLLSLLGAAVLFAALRGGPREWLVAFGILAPNLITPALCTAPDYCMGRAWPLRAWLSVGADGLVVATCVLATWRSQRYWTIWCGSFALASMLMNFIIATQPITFLGLWAISAANDFWALLVLATLTWGAAGGRRPMNGGAKARPTPRG